MMRYQSASRLFFRLQLLLAFVLLTGLAFSQPYPVGHRQASFIDASRNNRSVTCEVYYPAQAAGNNSTALNDTFPLLVFGHGFVMDWSAYDIYWNNLVPLGYVMIFPTTETSFSPSHTDFAKDMAFLVQSMQAENLNSTSPFFNTLGNRSAVMGHSMGGGCSFLAMQYNASITAIAAIAPAVTTPAYNGTASPILTPAIVFAGANDCVAPPSGHQLPLYDSLAGACKSYVSITGGNHCQFASTNFNCTLGQLSCSPQATITAAVQQGTLFGMLKPWLEFYLKGICSSAGVFQNLINQGNGITSLQNCTVACAVSGFNYKSNNTSVQVNFSDGRIHVAFDTNLSGKAFEVVDVNGKTIFSGIITNKNTYTDAVSLKPGVYFFRSENYTAKFPVLP